MPNWAGTKIEPREERLVSEYLERTWPKARKVVRVRLGQVQALLPTEVLSQPELNMIGVLRRWADAVVLLPDRSIIVEGAILPDPGDISRLLYYEALFKRTPEYSDRWPLPVEKVLLLAIPDPLLVSLGSASGVRVVTYTPAWIQAYVESLSKNKQRATPKERQ